MSEPATVDVPNRFARGYLDSPDVRGAVDEPEPVAEPRQISVAVLRDWTGLALVILGCVLGDVVAWVTGGWVAGTATLAGEMVGFGLVLGASSSS